MKYNEIGNLGHLVEDAREKAVNKNQGQFMSLCSVLLLDLFLSKDSKMGINFAAIPLPTRMNCYKNNVRRLVPLFNIVAQLWKKCQ